MTASRHRFRYRLETAAVRFAFWFLPRLSRRWVCRLARLFGTLALPLSPGLRGIGLANLAVAFGDKLSPSERRRILRGAYQSFALVLLDTFWFSRETRERLARWVAIGPDHERLLQPGAMVCVTLHLGNWEVFGMAVQARGQPLASVAAPLKNPGVDELFVAHRQRLGQKILTRQGAARGMLRELREGRKIAVVLDQNTSPAEGGIYLPFFGVPATVTPAPAALALKTRSPVLISACTSSPDGVYRTVPVTIIDPEDFPGGTGEDPAIALTRVIIRHMEAIIEACPEHWCWTYKRWKHRTDDMEASGFPFYTRVYRPR